MNFQITYDLSLIDNKNSQVVFEVGVEPTELGEVGPLDGRREVRPNRSLQLLPVPVTQLQPTLFRELS